MAEESGGDGWWGTWGSELLSTVKAKSAETLSLVRHDLSEFVTTIHHDTSTTIADTATAVKDQLKVDEEENDGSTTTVIKQGMSNWLGTISSALKENISHMAAAIDDEPPGSSSGQVFDRTQARRHEIQTDPATYCSDPDGHPVHYEEWCKNFDLEQHKGEISELLVNRPEIRALYTKLVPVAVHHSLFWHRYFYKIHQLDQEERRRAALVERANKIQEDELKWDDEEDGWDNEEVSKDQIENPIKEQPTKQEQLLTKEELVREETTTVESELDMEQQTTQSEDVLDKPSKESVYSDIIQVADEMDGRLNLDSQERGYAQEQVSDDQEGFTKEVNTFTAVSRDPTAAACTQASSALGRKPSDDQPILEDKEGDHPQDEVPQPPLEGSLQISVVVDESKSKGASAEEESSVQESAKDIKRENSTNGSMDSSWSRISEEELKPSKDTKQALDATKVAPSPSPSGRSSSSAVLLPPPPDDDDIAWDDDLDFGDEDVTDTGITPTASGNVDDDDDWENWE